MRRNISTHTPSEDRVGYSRAVVISDTIYVSGTVSIDGAGETIGKTLYEQSRYIFNKIIKVLGEAQFTLNDVIVIRAYVTDMNRLADFDRAFKEFFYDIKPTCTLVSISNLVKKDLLIEIECIAKQDGGETA